jgi:hypothetical protein
MRVAEGSRDGLAYARRCMGGGEGRSRGVSRRPHRAPRLGRRRRGGPRPWAMVSARHHRRSLGARVGVSLDARQGRQAQAVEGSSQGRWVGCHCLEGRELRATTWTRLERHHPVMDQPPWAHCSRPKPRPTVRGSTTRAQAQARAFIDVHHLGPPTTTSHGQWPGRGACSSPRERRVPARASVHPRAQGAHARPGR